MILNYHAVRCNTNNDEIGEWRLFLKLDSPGEAKALKILEGEPYNKEEITFTIAETEQSLRYQSGKWKGRINLSVKRSTDWWNTRVAREYIERNL